MNSFSMISYNGLQNSSFKAKLAMELHSHGHVQNGEVAKRANDVLKDLEVDSSNVTKEAALLGTKNERTDFGSTEHLALPTVFEGKITKEKKVTKQEKMSNIGEYFITDLYFPHRRTAGCVYYHCLKINHHELTETLVALCQPAFFFYILLSCQRSG